jgi:hypothetical protein
LVYVLATGRGTAAPRGIRGGRNADHYGSSRRQDREHWLASPQREEFLGPLGVTNIRTFVDPHNPNHVALLMNVPDLEAFNTAMQAPEAAEAMAHNGVLPETLVILVES